MKHAYDRQAGNASLYLLFAGLVLLAGIAVAVLLFLRAPGTSGETDPATPARSGDSAAPAPFDPAADSAANARAELADERDRLLDDGIRIRLVGTVLSSATSDPLPGALVRFLPTPRPMLASRTHDALLLDETIDTTLAPAEIRDALLDAQTVRTGDDGAFAFELRKVDLPGTLIAGGPGLSTAIRSVHDSGELEIRLTISLGVGFAIRGEVLEAGTGVPAAGMIVVASPVGPDEGAFSETIRGPRAVVRPDGSYSLVGLLEQEYRVVPRSGGTEFLGLSLNLARHVVPERGVDADGVDFQVTRGGVLFGRVTASDGTPVVGAGLSGVPSSFLNEIFSGNTGVIADMATEWKAATDDDGRYRILGIPYDREFTLLARSGDFAPAQATGITLADGERERRVDLTMTQGGTLRGIVLRPDRTPAPEERVTVIPSYVDLISGGVSTASVAGITTETTDDEGRFVFEHLPPGKVTLVAGEQNPYMMFDVGGTNVEVPEEGEVTGIELIVGAGGAKGLLTGRVVDETGGPLEGIRVEASCLQTDFRKVETQTTGADGAFSFEGFEDRFVKLEAKQEGFDEKAVETTGSSRDIVITLPRPAVVSGLVLTPDGVPPNGGFQVCARRISDAEPELDVTELFNPLRPGENWIEGREDGTFEIPAAPSGRVEIIAKAPGYAEGTSGELFLEPRSVHEGIEILLASGAFVAGRVLHADGTVASQAAVSVSRIGTDKTAEAMKRFMPGLLGDTDSVSTNTGGIYRAGPLEPGEYRVSASKEGVAPSQQEIVRVAVGARVTVPDLVLHPGATVRGRVLENGKGLMGVMTQLMGRGPMKMANTGTDGTFTFEGLGPGSYSLAVTDMSKMAVDGSFRYRQRQFTIEPGETKEIEFILGTGLNVRGTISNFAPGIAQLVTLRRPGGPGPEDYDPLDMDAAIDAARYQCGVGMVQPTGKFAMRDIAPGEYILEIPALPSNMADIGAYSKMDRVPLYRGTVRLQEEDLEVTIEVDIRK